MQPPPEIKNLKEFLEPHLNGAKFLDFSTKYLTAPGDNYGSTMLSVSVQIQKPNNNEPEILELVAKMPQTNQYLFEMFQTVTTFIKENAMYTEVYPALLQLQKEMNVPEHEIIDALPFCYGARISLDKNSMSVDSDALLLLENLKVKGFIVGDRAKGFNYEHTRVVLKNLANFHATPIALKYLKPTIFKEKVLQYVKRIDMEDGFDEHSKIKMTNALHEDIDKIKEISHISKQIKDQAELNQKEHNNKDNDLKDTPFTTIVHNDLWVNNMMIGYDKQGNPNAVKFVDFQMLMMDSIMHDLIFFLFSSVENDVLIEYLDDFLKYYYDCFYNYLKLIGCPLEDFTYEKYQNEVQRKAPYTLFHILLMLKVFLAKKEEISNNDDFEMDMFYKEEIVGAEYLEKFKMVCLAFAKRNWLI